MGYLFLLAYIIQVSVILMGSTETTQFVRNAVSGRIKRQDGYVYDKPSISFNLPTRPPSTVSTTQAPTVNSPQQQQMYYAYPVPVSGDTVNIGYSSRASSITSTAATTSASTTSANSGSGYNYGSPSTAATTSGSSIAGSNAGYNYNSPTSTAGTTAGVVSQTASTNAPKYLPPSSEGVGTGGGVTFNIPKGGSTTVSVSTPIQTSSSGIALPNTGYLPPVNQQSSPGPSASPSARTPSPPPPTAEYLPPSGSSSIPTPAATYLPPVL